MIGRVAHLCVCEPLPTCLPSRLATAGGAGPCTGSRRRPCSGRSSWSATTGELAGRVPCTQARHRPTRCTYVCIHRPRGACGAAACVAAACIWSAPANSHARTHSATPRSGHQSFSNNRSINDLVGNIVHASILVPYHGWRISHRTHREFVCAVHMLVHTCTQAAAPCTHAAEHAAAAACM
jgi:hypothetical protein